MRIVSGIQPSGQLHLGNYFGAIEQLLELQEAHDCFFFVADYHALTTVRDSQRLRQLRLDCMRDYLALGLDPHRVTIFFQSDVPAVTELAWILSTVTPVGLLLRSHAYKDKTAKGISADAGLFSYPVLMAADILLYGAELVPIGEEQTQHVEITRDIAERFNGSYGKLFRMPEARVVPLLAGTDGRKMSKSYGNSIEIFVGEDEVRAKVMKIQTDSLRADEVERRDVARRYGTGKVRYSEVKERLVESILAHFAEARRRREEYLARPELVEEAAAIGREKAAKEASEIMEKVRCVTGLGRVFEPQLLDRSGGDEHA